MSLTVLPPEQPVLYSQVRDAIQEGDVILFRGDRKLSRLISYIADSPYSHVGLVLTWYGRRILLSAEMPKIQALPLGLAVAGYHGRVDWYQLVPEARARLNRERLALEALTNLGIEYGARTLLDMGAHYTLGTEIHEEKHGIDDAAATPHSMVCSQYVSRCFRLAGVDLSDKSDVETNPSVIAGAPQLRFAGTLRREVDSAERARVEKAL